MFPHRPPLAFLAWLTLVNGPIAWAQMGLGDSPNSPDGQRPVSTKVDFFEFLQSGTEALGNLFRDAPEVVSADQPQWDGNSSPRETVMTFLEAMHHVALGRTEALPRAKKAFDGEVDQSVLWDLLHVFDRLPEIEPGTVPGADLVRQRDIRRYELFPRGIERSWAYRALDGPPEGGIVLIKSADEDRWYFDSGTVEGASGLLASLRPIPPRPRLEMRGGLFRSIMGRTLDNTTWKDWLWLTGWTAAALSLAWAVLRISRRVRNSDFLDGDHLVRPMVGALAWPLAVFLFFLGFAIGSSRIELHPALSVYRWRFIETGLLLSVAMVAVSLIELACLGMRRTFFSGNDPYANMMTIVLRRVIRVVAAVLVAAFIVQNVLKWNITAMLGGAALVGLLLSLAAKDAVKNLFGAITVYGNRPFIQGDWVSFKDAIGEVLDVGLQTTEIRVLGGEILSVPNMQFIDNEVKNLSLRKFKRRVMEVQVTYDTPATKIEQAIDILREVLTSEPIVKDHQCDPEHYPPHIVFESFGSHYLQLRCDYWYLMDPDGDGVQRDTERGFLSYLEHCHRVNLEVLRRFNDAGIEFAFPTQTLYLANDPERGLSVETTAANSTRSVNAA